MDIDIRPVTHNDLGLLAEWMNEPHWRKWWGEPEVELGYVKDMLAGKDTTRPFLFFVDGEPAGYIQYWILGDARVPPWCDDAPWVFEFSPQTIGADMSIGPAKWLSKGIGSRVLSQFVHDLRKDGFEDIIIDPDKENKRAIRAYEKAGFTTIERLKDKTDDVLLMQHRTH